jgi:hypothetical protein
MPVIGTFIYVLHSEVGNLAICYENYSGGFIFRFIHGAKVVDVCS